LIRDFSILMKHFKRIIEEKEENLKLDGFNQRNRKYEQLL